MLASVGEASLLAVIAWRAEASELSVVVATTRDLQIRTAVGSPIVVPWESIGAVSLEKAPGVRSAVKVSAGSSTYLFVLMGPSGIFPLGQERLHAAFETLQGIWRAGASGRNLGQ
jgi:hypothetical protein